MFEDNQNSARSLGRYFFGYFVVNWFVALSCKIMNSLD